MSKSKPGQYLIKLDGAELHCIIDALKHYDVDLIYDSDKEFNEELWKGFVDENEHIALSEKDSLHVLELLDNPPAPNKKLMAAVFVLPIQS